MFDIFLVVFVLLGLVDVGWVGRGSTGEVVSSKK
jgi:hypothetical protein